MGSPATRHKRTHPALTPAGEAGSLLDLTTAEGWKAELNSAQYSRACMWYIAFINSAELEVGPIF